MNRSVEPLEDRLRRALHQAAEQLDVPPVREWPAPSPEVSRHRAGHRGRGRGNVIAALGVVIAVLVAVLAVALLGHRHTHPASQPNSTPSLSPPPPTSFAPRLSRTDSR